jgi:hypothetical protein
MLYTEEDPILWNMLRGGGKEWKKRERDWGWRERGDRMRRMD